MQQGPELQMNKAKTTDTEAPFLDLHVSFENGFFLLRFMINAMTLILIYTIRLKFSNFYLISKLQIYINMN